MMMSPMGGAQELPEEVQEKMTSAVAAMVRAAAEQGGHDPKLGEAMVRADMEYKVGRKVISEAGQLLTLTNTEAEQLVGKTKKPLLSSGTVKDIDALLTQIGLPNAQQRIIEVTGAESIARTIAKIAPILMLIGMGSLWLEFKTPGIGIFGLLGGTCLLLFFLNIISPDSPAWKMCYSLCSAYCLSASKFLSPPDLVCRVGRINHHARLAH